MALFNTRLVEQAIAKEFCDLDLRIVFWRRGSFKSLAAGFLRRHLHRRATVQSRVPILYGVVPSTHADASPRRAHFANDCGWREITKGYRGRWGAAAPQSGIEPGGERSRGKTGCSNIGRNAESKDDEFATWRQGSSYLRLGDGNDCGPGFDG